MEQEIFAKKSETDFCRSLSDELSTVELETSQLRGVVTTMLTLADEQTAQPVEPRAVVNMLELFDHNLRYIEENVRYAIRALDQRTKDTQE